MAGPWRLVISGHCEPAWNMAVDEAILLACAGGRSPPTLRIYGWRPPALSLGRFQKAQLEVDLRSCSALGVEVIRRPTGGRAVLHDDEVTYSVVAGENLLPGGVLESCRQLASGLVTAVGLLGGKAEIIGRTRPLRPGRGSPACFEAPGSYEVAVGGRKLIGSAQVRKGGALLQHGSIPIALDAHKLFSLLKARGGRSMEDALEAFLQKATSLEEALGRRPGFGEVARALARGFADSLGVRFEEGELAPHEMELARALLERKYSTRAWNLEGGIHVV